MVRVTTVICDGCGARLGEARDCVWLTVSIEIARGGEARWRLSEGVGVGANIEGDYCSWKCLLARLAKEAGRCEDDRASKGTPIPTPPNPDNLLP